MNKKNEYKNRRIFIMKKQILILMITITSVQINAMDAGYERSFINAAANQNYTEVEKRIKDGMGAKSNVMNQALIKAINQKDKRMVELLILNGADPSYNDGQAFSNAIKDNNYSREIVETMLTTVPLQERETVLFPQLETLSTLKPTILSTFTKKGLDKNVAKYIVQLLPKNEFDQIVDTQLERTKKIITSAKLNLSCKKPQKDETPAPQSEELESSEDYDDFIDESQLYSTRKPTAISALEAGLNIVSTALQVRDLCAQLNIDDPNRLAQIRKQIARNITHIRNQRANRILASNYYKTLGVPLNATNEEIDRAFRERLAALQQFDTRATFYQQLGINPSATQEEINAAFEVRARQPIMEPNAYTVLGASQNASQQEIDEAYDELAATNLMNPQRAKEIADAYAQIHSESARREYVHRMKEPIYQAYKTLGDATNRKAYNKELYPSLYKGYEVLKDPTSRRKYDYSLRFIAPQF